MLGQRAGLRETMNWHNGVGSRGWGCCLGSCQAHSQMLVRHASMNAAEKLRGTQQLSLLVSIGEAN